MSRLDAYKVYLTWRAAASVLSSMIFTVLAVYYVKEAGLNPLQLVLVGTVLETSYFIFEVPTGVVADTYSRRLSVIVGQVLIGTCYVIQGFAPLFAAILIAEAIRGIGETFVSGALEAWIADEVGEERVGQVYLRGSQFGQIGALVGTFVGVGLASIRLALPVALGGAFLVGLGGFLAVAMPEHNFHPTARQEKGSLQAMGETLHTAVEMVRGRPLILTILAIGIVFGAFSEGLDRLWEAHFLTNFAFPPIGDLDPIVWFGVISAGARVLSLGASEAARRRVDTTSHPSVARALFVLTALLSASVVAFGLAGTFALALAARWTVSAIRTTIGPLYIAWLNQQVDSRVRATAISMSGQADSLGQIVGGPGIGAVATVLSLRAALVISGAMLSPALLLYARTVRRGSTGAELSAARQE